MRPDFAPARALSGYDPVTSALSAPSEFRRSARLVGRCPYLLSTVDTTAAAPRIGDRDGHR